MKRALVFNIGPGPWSEPCWYWNLAHYLEMNRQPPDGWLMVELMDHVERTAGPAGAGVVSVVPPPES